MSDVVTVLGAVRELKETEFIELRGNVARGGGVCGRAACVTVVFHPEHIRVGGMCVLP